MIAEYGKPSFNRLKNLNCLRRSFPTCELARNPWHFSRHSSVVSDNIRFMSFKMCRAFRKFLASSQNDYHWKKRVAPSWAGSPTEVVFHEIAVGGGAVSVRRLVRDASSHFVLFTVLLPLVWGLSDRIQGGHTRTCFRTTKRTHSKHIRAIRRLPLWRSHRFFFK